LTDGSINGAAPEHYGGAPVVTQLEDGWWRVVAKFTPPENETLLGGNFALFALVNNSTSYEGDGVSGPEFRNIQEEAGTVDTPYQRTTDTFLAPAPDHLTLTGDRRNLISPSEPVLADGAWDAVGIGGDPAPSISDAFLLGRNGLRFTWLG